jgi:zinc transport system substrate-binding protein
MIVMSPVHRTLTAVVALAAALGGVLAMTGCTAASAFPAAGKLGVVTSFYPLEFVVSRIGGTDVDVTSLTRTGVEPHDLELTPRDVARMQDAGLVVYLRGFQPAVDQAVDAHTRGQRVLDVAPAADLVSHRTEDLGDPHRADDAHEHDALDPHFWLDPQRLASVSRAVADAMGAADPAGAKAFDRRADALLADLHRLDGDFRDGLRTCSNPDLVTSHSAFGYLADRYGLQQVGITGLTPEAEPDPRSLAQVADFVRRHHVTTIYYETLASPDVARTIAQETGATTAVLDPLEGLDDASAGDSYLEVMRSNLATLRKGQSCA